MPRATHPQGKMTRQMAQTIAGQGLAFLAEEPRRLARFFDLTGLRRQDVRAELAAGRLDLAVLEHLAADESLLLAFAANRALAPEKIKAALCLLEAR